MFFDDITSIPKIAAKEGFSIFILPSAVIDAMNATKKVVKTAATPKIIFPPTTIYLQPDEKNVIRVDKIRELEAEMSTKKTSQRFFVVKHAETINEAAENAALKLCEEPKENCHLVFLATDLTAFLPTILSRASVYVQRVDNPLDQPINASEETLSEARSLLKSTGRETLLLVNRWTDKKSKKERQDILKILSCTIEIAYKSYFKTGNPNFLKKVPNLITAYENIKGNGHIKLQLTAHLC